MAIKTGAIFNSLQFGGIDSADFGIYITGEAVYNAPERAVELVSVPGRNGAIAIDQGHWENIEIEYPAGLFGDDQTNFRKAMNDFRNACMAQLGYQRLTDTYHPDEYRMAMFISGLEAEAVETNNGTGAEFTLKFNAKPQRWLTSGEMDYSVNSGGYVPNATKYDSLPTIKVEGEGNITIGDSTIRLSGGIVGYVVLSDGGHMPSGYSMPIDTSLVGSVDDIYIENFSIRASFISDYPDPVSNISFIGPSSPFSAYSTILPDGFGGEIYVSASNLTMKKTDVLTDTFSATFTAGANTATVGLTLTVGFTSEFKFSGSLDVAIAQAHVPVTAIEWETGKIDCQSTETKLGHPTIIDCEMGEAYKIVNGQTVSLNSFIDLGSDLPKLSPGLTTITYDNTITDFKIVPRWWEL